jgi:hypothetical protein
MIGRALLGIGGLFGLGLALGAVFMQYQRPELGLSWLSTLLGCG